MPDKLFAVLVLITAGVVIAAGMAKAIFFLESWLSDEDDEDELT